MMQLRWTRALLGGSALAALAMASPAMAADCGALARMALPNGKVTSAEVVAPGAFVQPAAPGGRLRASAAALIATCPSSAACRRR
jgi:hypothetical protein